MGWAIAGGILGLVIMGLAWYWLRNWAESHYGGSIDARIGSRPLRLAGIPEEANPEVKAAPAMEVLAIADLRSAEANALDQPTGSARAAEAVEVEQES